MNKRMKAICLAAANQVELQNVPVPEKTEPGHYIVKMTACGINAGDKAFITGLFPKGTIPVSQYEIGGVSGVGVIEQVGSDMDKSLIGKNVTIYRSLKFGDSIVGAWSEYAHVHQHHCVLLPTGVNPEEYAGSLVNVITPYAFLKQAASEGHKGVIATAGTSATGIAMLGVCQIYDFPIISIVRDEAGKNELEAFGANHVLSEADTDFKQQLAGLSQQLGVTAVFDGVGGSLINRIVDAFARHTTIYSYGYLGGPVPYTIPTGLFIAKALTVKGFGNFTSKTVQDPQLLNEALDELSKIIDRPHFKTKIGKKFGFGEIKNALDYSSAGGGKAILYPAW